ncbi:MAG TPA: isocitrate lyase/phosphoenolpyruvate mutase family protein [Vicinamibacteria bacterium]|nr:isocitrate lyase/phosphoenolpyruvate mutase family protein [Vicinamibacteria bacterium]
MITQAEKAERFRALHRRKGAFIIPNPWDLGSARLLAALGFEALATTSSGFANSLGRADGEVALDEKLEHCRALSAATEIPVSADLENCFADDPETAAETITLAGQAGVVGGSIEDYSGDDSRPIYDLALAVERVAAAVEAARKLPFPFTLTARAENLLHGRDDLNDTIERLLAFESAGADVLYAPGLETLDQVREVTRAVGKPVNVLAPPLRAVTFAQLAEAGAQRVSIGGALCRAAFSSVMRAAAAMRDSGSFGWTGDLLSSAEIERLFRKSDP